MRDLLIFRNGSIVVYADLQLAPYNTLSELSLVLYDVSVAANSSQLGGQDNTGGSVVVEIQGTNYTGKYPRQQCRLG